MNKLLLASGISVLLSAAPRAHAAVLFDSFGFENPAYTLGPLAGQHNWTFVGNPTASVVENSVAASGSQAVILSGSTTTWVWPSLDYIPPPGELVRVSFDIRRSSFTANNNLGYFVDIYNTSAEGGNRVARAGLTRTGTQTAPGNVQGMVTIGGIAAGNYLVGNPLQNNTWYTFVMDLNFATDTFSVTIDGFLVGANLPFDNVSVGIGDADLQISAVADGSDAGYIDNYRVITIPEPASISLLALGGMLMPGLRRRFLDDRS